MLIIELLNKAQEWSILLRVIDQSIACQVTTVTKTNKIPSQTLKVILLCSTNWLCHTGSRNVALLSSHTLNDSDFIAIHARSEYVDQTGTTSKDSILGLL